MISDFKLAVRALRRRPGFTSAVVLTLSLGIGGSVAIFGVVDAVLLRPLPFPEPDRLVEVWETVEREEIEERAFSYPDFLDLRRQSETLDVVAAVAGGFATLSRPAGTAADSERVATELASPELFDLLGVVPALGSALTPGAPDRVVISHALWQRRFGGDRAIVGSRLLLDGEPVTVAGVAPRGFLGVFGEPALWRSIEALPPRLLEERSSRWHSVVGRLAPGATLEGARREVATIFARLAAEHSSNRRYSATLGALQQRLLGDFRRPLALLFGAVALVLVVASVNAANLMIVRASGQRRQTALLAAVGASPGQLARSALVESLVLGLVAGVVALLIAAAVLPVLIQRSPIDLPAFVGVSLSARVLGVALALSLVCSLVLGVVAWWTTGRHALSEVVQGARGTAARRQRARSGLLVFEIALSLVVAVSAGLLLRSWHQTGEIAPGFALEDRVLLQIGHPGFDGDDAAPRAAALRRAVADELAALPGVEGVSLASDLPLSGGAAATVISPEGRAFDDALPWSGATRVYRHHIDDRLLDTLEIPLLAGRGFDASELGGERRVALVSRTLADRLWHEGDVVGRRFKIGRPLDPAAEPDTAEVPWVEVVGVVADVRYRALLPGADAPPPDPDVYFPLLDRGSLDLAAVVRSSLEPAAVARDLEPRLARIDPLLVVYAPETFADRIAAQTTRLRFSTLLMTLFAALALGLAAVGVHGVMSFLVAERRSEIGVRLAIGAARGQVVREVVAQGLRPLAVGLVLGTFASLAATRLLSTLLVGVGARDPWVLLAAALLLAAVATAACALPARRASQVDPLVALRDDR